MSIIVCGYGLESRLSAVSRVCSNTVNSIGPNSGGELFYRSPAAGVGLGRERRKSIEHVVQYPYLDVPSSTHMCPSLINYFTGIQAYLEGDGSLFRKLALQSVSDMEDYKLFHLLVKSLNVSSDEVRDSQIFAKCGSLELMKYLAENYDISEDDAIEAFHRACEKGSKDTVIWIAEQFQLTKEDSFSQGQCRNGWTIIASRNLDFIKWLVEKYQLTLADMELGLTYVICRGPEIVRWFGSNFEFERADVVEAFVGACGVSIEPAKWLVEKYKLTPTEIRSNNNKALRFCGDCYTRDWLVKNYYAIN